MRVAVVINCMGEGGAQKSLINLLQMISPEYYDIDLILFEKRGIFLGQVPKWVNVPEPDGRLYYCYKKSFGGMFGGFKAFLGAMSRGLFTPAARILSRGNADLARQIRWRVYKRVIPKLTEEYDTAIAFMHGEPIYYVIDKINAKRKIGWVHNDYSSTGYEAKRDLPYFERLDEIVTISDECLEILKKEFPAIKNKFTCLPNLISEELIRKMAKDFLPEEYIGEKNIILSIGRLEEQKGFDIAVRAAAILKNTDFKWFIIGSGSLERELKQLCTELGVNDRIEFLGQRANPYPYIKNCTVVAQTSRYEGKSIVLDEAKILGKAVLATNYNTVYDQLGKNEGMVVEMTPEGVALGLERLINDGSLRKSYEERLLKGHYGNEDVLKKYYRLISGE